MRSWDGAVAFYTGSLEGERGDLSNGVFPHNQADQRCRDFKTCGPSGGAAGGVSMVNHKIFRLMAQGQSNLLMGNCADTPPLVRAIVAQMAIPQIQGVLRYSRNPAAVAQTLVATLPRPPRRSPPSDLKARALKTTRARIPKLVSPSSYPRARMPELACPSSYA